MLVILYWKPLFRQAKDVASYCQNSVQEDINVSLRQRFQSRYPQFSTEVSAAKFSIFLRLVKNYHGQMSMPGYTHPRASTFCLCEMKIPVLISVFNCSSKEQSYKGNFQTHQQILYFCSHQILVFVTATSQKKYFSFI